MLALPRFGSFFTLLAIGMGLLIAAEPTQAPSSAEEAKAKLAEFQFLIGGWKGVGQPQRGSTKNNWNEQTEWVWDFSEKMPAIVGQFKEARFFQTMRIAAAGGGKLTLTASTSAGKVHFTGQRDDDGKITLVAADAQGDLPQKITVRTVANGDRLLVLYERPSSTSGNWQRLGEVGSTRIGSDFGKGNSQPECVVTGGLGTIPVMHEGKTYYVCCSGCRDLFNERPAEVLQEYRAKKEAEAKKKGMK